MKSWSEREREVIEVADQVRTLHRVPAVLVLFIEADACPMGFSIATENKEAILPILPAKLREVAALLERGVETVDRKTKLP